MTIIFPNGNRAQAIQAPADADGATLVAALELPPPRTVLLLSGGASAIPSTGMDQLRRVLVEGVARLAAEEGITVIDGGTQAGVMQMMGEGRATAGGGGPLIGVCPAALVSWPGRALSLPKEPALSSPKGGPTGGARVPLEPNHTHFALTGGDGTITGCSALAKAPTSFAPNSDRAQAGRRGTGKASGGWRRGVRTARRGCGCADRRI